MLWKLVKINQKSNCVRVIDSQRIKIRFCKNDNRQEEAKYH